MGWQVWCQIWLGPFAFAEARGEMLPREEAAYAKIMEGRAGPP